MKDSTSEFVSLWTQALPEVRRYIDLLLPRTADAEDVVQQTATRLWDSFNEYDPDRPFVPWAIRFAYHEVLSWRQRNKRDRLVFSQEIIAQLHAKIAEDSSFFELRRLALDECLQQLDENERTMLLRRYAEHGSVQQDAKRMQISPNKLYYSIEKMRIRLLECINARLNLEGWQHG